MTARTEAMDLLLIDDFHRGDGRSRLGTEWRLVTDRVMGGVSAGQMATETVDGRRALCMHGEVSLENDGGFVQVALDLAARGYLDASNYTGVRLVVRGNGEHYNLHLRTADVQRPWQSYRSGFRAGPTWETVELPFARFEPYRLDAPLDTRCLTRLGVVAIGRAFTADLCIAELVLYRAPH